MTDLFREIERRVESRRTARLRAAFPLTFPGEKLRPKLPNWRKPEPYRPVMDYQLRSSQF
jgi:hypothetical protein